MNPSYNKTIDKEGSILLVRRKGNYTWKKDYIRIQTER